jgi:glycyl-tRNA synthetase beta chain
MTAALLVEVLTEELPPKALRHLGYAFADALVKDLRNDGFAPGDGVFSVYATPRRLGVLVRDVAERAPDREALMKGPSVKAGLGADGVPSPALLGFAKKQGVAVEQLVRIDDGKHEIFAYRSKVIGARLDDILAAKLATALGRVAANLKNMRWGDHDDEFVRPVRGLVMLHGERVVPGKVLGQEGGRTTRGHRFMGHGEVSITRADEYEAILERDGKVIANFELRAQRIRAALIAAAGSATIAADDALYDEVTALVEYPAVYEAHFESRFLEVPQECLMLTMKQNQKYFPLVDGQGKLANRFLIVSNMAIAQPHNIVHGNERVLRARLADAKFFYDQDRRRRLESRVASLANVVFHNKLGSQLERVERLEQLAALIGRTLGVDEHDARRAARLAKADLLTGMVGEFPELQGIMGMYYARHDGEPESVAAAIEAHYHPRFAGDALPAQPLGATVALADKIDSLVGLWAAGGAPTGDKDPFTLRRAALGIVRMLAEQSLPLDIVELLRQTRALYARAKLADATDALHDFILDRARPYLRERTYAPDEIEAVLTSRPVRLDRIVPRLEAVRAFRKLPEAESLAAANKRIRNILLKSPPPSGDAFDERLLEEEAERKLHHASTSVEQSVRERTARGEYADALQALAALRGPVDAFFEHVLVNAPRVELRNNRLALLLRLEGAMNQVADISKLAA